MSQGLSLKSERNNPWFKPWFNISLHTQSIVYVCHSIISMLRVLGINITLYLITFEFFAILFLSNSFWTYFGIFLAGPLFIFWQSFILQKIAICYGKFWLQGLNFVKSMFTDNLWAINMVDFNLLSCSELPFTCTVQTVISYKNK